MQTLTTTAERTAEAIANNPFVREPALQELASELHVNVGQRERTLSTVGGVALLAAGLTGGRGMRWLLLASAALLARGLTGHCTAYYLLGKDTRHYGGKAR